MDNPSHHIMENHQVGNSLDEVSMEEEHQYRDQEMEMDDDPDDPMGQKRSIKKWTDEEVSNVYNLHCI